MGRVSIEIDTHRHLSPIPAASRVGPLVMSSIIVGREPGTRHAPDDVAAQIANLFEHIGALLAEADADWGDIVKINFWVPAFEHRALIDDPWVAHFPDPAARPARHVQVGSDVARCDFVAYAER